MLTGTDLSAGALQVWKGTTSLGCGYSACDGFPLYVCNYSPPANVAGQYSANVLPPAN